MRIRFLQVPLLGAVLFFATSAPCASPASGNPLRVEYAGCRAVLLPGRVCVLPPTRKFSLWVETPPEAQVELRADGRRIEAAGEPVQNGQRFSLILPLKTDRLYVLAETPEKHASWFLALGEPERGKSQGLPHQETSRDVLAEVAQKMSLVQSSIDRLQLTAARKTLNSLWISPEEPAESRLNLAYYRSLLAEKEGDYRSALAEIQKALEIAERTKLDLHKWVAEEQLALLLRGVGRSREAAQLFERLRRTPQFADSCREAQLLSNQAWSILQAREAGESFADPTRLLETALRTYESCPKAPIEKRVNILINLVLSHLQGGRLAQAKELLAQVQELEPHPTLPIILWRLDLEARIALREGRPVEALDLFEHLGDLARETSSPHGMLRAEFGLAQSQQASGDRNAAFETLRKAEALLDEQSLQIPIHQGRETFMATRQALVSLHIEILLDQGRNAEALGVTRHALSRMLRQLERSDRLANLPPDQRARWEDFLQRYQEKRTALEERAKDDWKLPTDQLRRERAARQVETQAVRELLDQAFLVLNDSSELPGEALAPPRPGELLLTWCPLPRPRSWVGFAADGETITVHRFELPQAALLLPGELSLRLLKPFRSAIEKAERIRILPIGPLLDVDFHALPFAGDILLASRPVVYGLDLPVPSGLVKPSGRRALLVADPRDDLPGALDEARMVREVLEAGSPNWIIEELKSTEASAETVQRRLIVADLLHYAGHGIFSGFGGWDSSLLLAGQTRLTLSDLLALERVPAWVVLSGCDTGRSSTGVPVQSLGLAHTFLLAGSQGVVASTRPADDLTVPWFLTEFYRQWEREPDPAVALQRAQLAWRKRNPGADWRGFRLFEP